MGFSQSSAVIKAQLNGIRIAGAVAGAELKAAFTAPSTVSWRNFFTSIKAGATSTIALCKSGITALGVGIKGLAVSIATSFAPFMIIFGIVEAIQGMIRINEMIDRAKNTVTNIKSDIAKAQTAEDNEKIHALSEMKRLLGEINKEQSQNNGLSEQSFKNLMAIANRLKLSEETQKKLYELQKEQRKEQEKRYEAQKKGDKAAEDAANAKIKALKVEKGIYDEIAKKIEDNIKTEEAAAERKVIMGMYQQIKSDMAKFAIDSNMKKLGIDPMDTRAVANQLKHAYDKESEIGKWLSKFGTIFTDETLYYNSLRAEEALNFLNYYEPWIKEHAAEVLATPVTAPGDFDPSDLGGGREKNAKFSLLAIKAWFEKQLNTVGAKLETDQEEQEAKKLIAQYDNLVIEAQKKLEEIDNALAEGKKMDMNMRRQILQLSETLTQKLPQAQENELWGIIQKYNIKAIDEKIKGLQQEINNLSKVNTYPGGENEQRSYPQYEKYTKERQILSLQKEKEDLLLMEQFMRGDFGEVFEKGTYDDALKGYNAYIEQMADIKESPEIGEDVKNQLLKRLDEKYKAEAEFYRRSMLLEQKYDNDLLATERAEFAEESKMRAQFIENELSAEQLKYERMLNMAYDYYQDLQNYIWDSDINDWIWQPTEEYFKELGGRIGEFEANQFKLELEQAKQELQSIVNAGYDERVESYESYQARVIEAKKKVVDVHTKANEAIEASDEARFQATQTVTEGLIKLTEELGQEDKEAAKLAKTLALFNIMVSTAEAIAKMTSRESGKGVIGIGTAAAGIATILANMASAISILKQAKYAKGAVNIGGAGTETSDSIPAYISRGESVMNAKATKMFEPLLIAMNAIGNGVALPRNNYVRTQQTADITEAFTEAVANVRPVVDVREITSTQNRVEVVQNLDSI